MVRLILGKPPYQQQEQGQSLGLESRFPPLDPKEGKGSIKKHASGCLLNPDKCLEGVGEWIPIVIAT